MSEEKIPPSAWRKIILALISVLKAVLRGFANENENRPKGGHEPKWS